MFSSTSILILFFFYNSYEHNIFTDVINNTHPDYFVINKFDFGQLAIIYQHALLHLTSFFFRNETVLRK